MNQFIRTIVFGLVFVGLMTACDSSVTEVQRPAPDDGPVAASTNPYQSVGKDHNTALDAVLADLQSLRATNMTKDELRAAAYSSLETYAKKQRWSGPPSEALVELAKNLGADTSGGPMVFSKIVPKTMRSSLTSRQTHYVHEVTKAMSSGLSSEDLDATLTTIETDATKELGDRDARVVLETSAVARSSSTYWDGHYGDWAKMATARTGDTVGSGTAEQKIPVDVADAIGQLIGGKWGATVASVVAVLINIWVL